MGGVTMLITSTKYFTEFKNGIGFASNPSDFAFNLQGNVGEKVKVVREIQLSWRFEATTANPVTVTPLGGLLWSMTSGGATFASQNMAVGDNMVITWTDNNGSGNAEDFLITGITGTQLIAQQTAGPLPSSGVNGFSNSSVSLRGREAQTSLQYEFGLLGNNESYNVLSKVSNNSQAYYSASVGLGNPRSTLPVTMQKLGIYEDWRTGDVTIRYVGQTGFLNLTQVYEVSHEFMINPFYLDGELTNLQNNVIPPLLNGLNSLKYVFNAEFRTTASNPNSAKPYQYEESLGSVAWFNENFNGFNVDYAIDSVTYEEQATTTPSNGILIGSKTRIRVQVSRLSGSFSGAERYGAYISYLPDQAEYTNTTLSNLADNFIYDNVLNSAGLPGVAGQDFITTTTASVVAGKLLIIIDTDYSTAQKIFLSNKLSQQPTRYLLGIQVGDNNLTNTTSDRTILLADTELYDASPDISDLMHVTKLDIYPHDQQKGVGTPSTDMTGWNEDGLFNDIEFDLNLNLSAVMNSLNLLWLAYNPVTGQYWEIDSYSFSPATAIVSSGVQQITANTTRNYILKAGDQFNDVIITIGAQVAGLQKYNIEFGQKISWQDWLPNLGVDTVFYNSSEPQNNMNNKSSNYSLLNGYEIRLGIFANVFGTSPLNVSGLTDYLFLSPTIKVFDYEKDGIIPPVWSCVIETFDAINNTNLSGAVLAGTDTLFRCTWTNKNGAVGSLGSLYGINRIEETGQQGYAKTEMSSINLPKPTGTQLLKPSVGTLLDLTLVAGNVVFECLIDGSLVTPGINYNLSSRIHDPSGAIIGKVTETSVPKDTEGGVQKEIE